MKNHLTLLTSLLLIVFYMPAYGQSITIGTMTDGVEGVGHRKIMMSESIELMGVSIEPHSAYGSNCVLDFLGK